MNDDNCSSSVENSALGSSERTQGHYILLFVRPSRCGMIFLGSSSDEFVNLAPSRFFERRDNRLSCEVLFDFAVTPH